MSSILDALKKIDEESVHTSGLRPRIRREAGAGDRIRFFIIDRALVLVLAAGLIGTGAGGFWAYSSFQSVPEQMQTASVAEPPMATVADEKLTTKPKAATPPVPAPVTRSKESNKPPTAQPYPEKANRQETPVAPPVPVRPETRRSPAPLAQTPVHSTPPAATRPERPSEHRAERRVLSMEPMAKTADRIEPDPKTAPESDSVPILEDSSLTLQAISWANRPENRIAVINGSICREGEKIDRFVLQQINPDDIRIADGKKMWRLEFKIK